MTGRTSNAMLQALSLVKQGYNGLQAAKAAGVHPSSLYRSAGFKALRAERTADAMIAGSKEILEKFRN